MIQKAYIILAHKNPEQVRRLIEKLDDGSSTFFIHVDKNVPTDQFKELDAFQNKVKFVKREKTNWASYGLVMATVNALKEIRASGQNFGQIILLSGQDYPIKSNAFIDRFFKQSEYSLFIEYFTIPNHDKWEPRGGLYRVDRYYLGHRFHEKYTAKAINFLSSVLTALKRKMPDNLTPYAGSQWWIIDMYAVNYILDFLDKHPDYISFHRHTFAADEVFFQTILLNAKDEHLQKNLSNDNKRFLSWEDTSNAHPDVLTKKDIQALQKSPALFARKFDTGIDIDIFNLIDDRCLSNA